jgi:hypothetical protein
LIVIAYKLETVAADQVVGASPSAAGTLT